MPAALTEASFATAIAELARRDPALARIIHDHGHPPFWVRPPGFTTLVHIILEQQVSLASAQAALDKLLGLTSPLTPENFLAHSDETLRAAGFSRQKTRYCRLLASALLTGELNLDTLPTLPDEQAHTALTALTGIGAWTADIYLLMALRRPDTWPAGDLALQVAVQRIRNLPARPASPDMPALAENWRPWRAVAARILWHDYLSR